MLLKQETQYDNYMKIFISTDHAGYVLKEELVLALTAQGHEIVDKGAYGYNEGDDFPDFVIPLAREVSQNSNPDLARGIILGATGEAEAFTANKFPHVRAVVYYGKSTSVVVDDEVDIIVRSRTHHNTNVLILGARFFTHESILEAVTTWLSTPFEAGEKHLRRLAKVDAIKI